MSLWRLVKNRYFAAFTVKSGKSQEPVRSYSRLIFFVLLILGHPKVSLLLRKNNVQKKTRHFLLVPWVLVWLHTTFFWADHIFHGHSGSFCRHPFYVVRTFLGNFSKTFYNSSFSMALFPRKWSREPWKICIVPPRKRKMVPTWSLE